MLAWTRRQIERGHLNSKSLSKSFLEFSRRVHEQEAGRGKGIQPMESFSLQTLTSHNELPMLLPSTPGGENFQEREQGKHRRQEEEYSHKPPQAQTLLQLRGDGPLCPPEQQFQKNFLILLFYCCFLVGSFYSKSIVSMDLKLFKSGLNQGYYNFQTQISRLRGRCAGWRERSCSATVGNCKLLDITWLKQAGLLGQCLNMLNMPGLTHCTVRSDWLCPESRCIWLFVNPFCKVFKPGYKPDLPLSLALAAPLYR